MQTKTKGTQTIVVGGGPSGIATAFWLSRRGHRVTLLERESELGGCHRVLRSKGYFTEHAPRMYLSSYTHFFSLLNEMNIDGSALFVPYEHHPLQMVLYLLHRLTWFESMQLAWAWLVSRMWSSFGQNVRLSAFVRDWSPGAKDMVDRLCRMVEGGGLERYTLRQFLVMGSLTAKPLQPRFANDRALLPLMRRSLEGNGVSIQTNSQVHRIEIRDRRVVGVWVRNTYYPCDKLVLCMPPTAVFDLMIGSSLNAFPTLSKYVKETRYDTYLSATFHWHHPFAIQSRWGFPQSAWGLVSVLTSAYTTHTGSAVVISVTCFYLDRPGRDGKTANETPDAESVLREMFVQLLLTYPDLPVPDVSLLSPTNYYDGGWRSKDSGVVHTSYLPAQSPNVSNLFQVGPQNGFSTMPYSTIEAAVENAEALLVRF